MYDASVYDASLYDAFTYDKSANDASMHDAFVCVAFKCDTSTYNAFVYHPAHIGRARFRSGQHIIIFLAKNSRNAVNLVTFNTHL